ncbi:hypothetical protein H5P36_19015 [Bacillus sp. APMAM]|nr:hypothetical protein [Bacillus sp. APMAM]RTZ54370.1 hypothetical protein EKO25_18480 [Bacillus sp. SAJ1]
MEINVEKQILAALQQINDKLDSHSEILESHSEMLKEHSGILKDHSEMLKEHSEMLKEHSVILKSHSEMFKIQGETLKEHTSLLSALKTGQESLKVELNEMKLQNAKDFGEVKEQLESHETSIEMLKEDVWDNKKDIRRIQKTMGMN